MVSVSSLLNCQNIYTNTLQIHVEVMYEYATLLGLIQANYRYSSLRGNMKSVLYLSEIFLITK